MLEHPGPGEGALFGDVTDQQNRRAVGLGVGDESVSTLTNLRNRARGRTEVGIMQGLDRVDHDDLRLHLLNVGHDVRERRLRHQPQCVLHRTEAVGAAADLPRRLLTRHVETRDPGRRRRPDQLQQQGRLADTRLPTNERDRTRDKPATEDPIDLGQASGASRSGDVDHVGDARRARRWRPHGRGLATDVEFLDERVPLAATAAAPHPLGAGPAALGATMNGLGAGHDRTLRGRCDGLEAQEPRLRRRSSKPRTIGCSVSGAASFPVTNRPVAMPSSFAVSRCSGLFDR